MKAVRIHRFGSPSVIVVDDVLRPAPGPGEVLVKVAAAGVGPWDALIREGKSKVAPAPPLTLGSDFSGVIEDVRPGVVDFKAGDEVFGVTNPQFCGAYAEYAVASSGMVARKPARLGHVESASVPVVAVTAWQMLFDYARVESGQRVLILGAAGNVGAYAVQLALWKALDIVAVASSKDIEFVHGMGNVAFVDYNQAHWEEVTPPVDAVLDTVGGEVLEKSLRFVKPGGIVVSAVSGTADRQPAGLRFVFFYVEVTTARLDTIAAMLDAGSLLPTVGTVLPLQQARTAHELLAGAPHKRGKIVLEVAA